MLYTYFKEIPVDILEAARMDGATLWNEIVYVLTPMAVPGIASTLLLNIILAWNEAFWTIRLTTTERRAADRLHRVVLEPAGPVLGQALGGLDARHRADPAHGLVQPEATRPRPDLRRGEIRELREENHGLHHPRTRQQVLRRRPIIPDIDLDIEDGEFVVFVGPSGCGKSTLLRLIAGLEDTTGGIIQLDGEDVTDEPPAQRGLAMVFQSYALYPHMTVRNNIDFPLKMAGKDKAVIDKKVEGRRARAEPHRLSRPPAAASSPAASASASPSAAPSCASPRPSCSTSRCRTSTRRCASTCGSRSPNCTSSSRPRWSTSPTTRSRP